MEAPKRIWLLPESVEGFHIDGARWALEGPCANDAEYVRADLIDKDVLRQVEAALFLGCCDPVTEPDCTAALTALHKMIGELE